MGPFRFTCACLVGAFLLASAYQALIWVRDRRQLLSLAAALHAGSSGLFAWSLLRLANAATVVDMQHAVNQRALAAIPVVLAVTFQLAAFARLPPARYVLAVAGATAATIVARLVAGTAANDVVGIEQVVRFGEQLSAPIRLTGPAHWMAAGIVAAAALFAIWCGWRMWATDRIGGALVMVTGVSSLATAPFVAVLRPWAMPLQPLTLAPQALFVLVAAMHVAREHEARARAMLSAERLYHAMFDQTYQLAGLLDLQGRVLEASRSMIDACGLAPAAIVGRPYADMPGWQSSPARQRLQDAIASATAGTTSRQEVAFIAPSGEARVLDVSIRPLRDEEQRVIRLIAEARDVTDERHAQDAHRRIEAQLHQSQKLEAVGQLAGGIAHDFNNLLTVIHGFASLLTTAPDCGGRRVELEQIQSASERAMVLTRQLLTFSHHAVPDARVIDLNELVRRTEPLLQRLVGADIRIRVRTTTDLPAVKADPSQLERVLINLVVNARDAMPHGGQVDIGTRTPNPVLDDQVASSAGHGAVLTVSDTGIGMPPDVQARLFEPFFTTKAPGKGTGLGLAIVDRVVKQARGTVAVSSTPNRGTTFTIYLPP
ncbi:MAG TPA: ATP-binding protein, partial [Luteitalea sp.]|nr:ATP-binding protein [Luteitalea sp.]